MEFADYVALLRRRGWVVALGVILAMLGAGLVTSRMTPVYDARTQLFVGAVGAAGSESQLVQDSTVSLTLARSYTLFATSPRTVAEAAQLIHRPISPASISAQQIPDSQVLQIDASASSPVEAARAANAVAAALLARIDRFHPGAAGRLSRIDYASPPPVPASPRPALNLAVGALIGLILGFGGAYLLDSLDGRMRRREHGEELTGPILAELPHIPDSNCGEAILERRLQPGQLEPVRRLAVVVEHMCQRDHVRSLLITSAQRADGKTTVVSSLALALSERQLRVALIEGDFGSPGLVQEFHLNGNMAGREMLLDLPPLPYYEIDARLTVFADGEAKDESQRRIPTAKFRELLGTLRERYDLVLVDGPPLLAVAEAGALARQVDGVLMVIREGDTSIEELTEARRQLQTLGARVLGSVVNEGLFRPRRYSLPALTS